MILLYHKSGAGLAALFADRRCIERIVMTGLKKADVSRREFVHCVACATAAAGSLAASPMALAAQQAVLRGKEAVHEFPYGAVRLTGGRIKQHYDHIAAHYLALDNDRLLKVFRQNAGLPAPGPDMPTRPTPPSPRQVTPTASCSTDCRSMTSSRPARSCSAAR